MNLPPAPKLNSPESSIDSLIGAFQEAFLDFKVNTDDQYLLAMEAVWNECTERFKEINEHSKKAR